jgi:hypothetical protein
LLSVMRDGFEQDPQVRHKQPSASVRGRGETADPLIVIRIFLLPGLNEAFTENVDAPVAGVKEKVISSPAPWMDHTEKPKSRAAIAGLERGSSSSTAYFRRAILEVKPPQARKRF